MHKNSWEVCRKFLSLFANSTDNLLTRSTSTLSYSGNENMTQDGIRGLGANREAISKTQKGKDLISQACEKTVQVGNQQAQYPTRKSSLPRAVIENKSRSIPRAISSMGLSGSSGARQTLLASTPVTSPLSPILTYDNGDEQRNDKADLDASGSGGIRPLNIFEEVEQ